MKLVFYWLNLRFLHPTYFHYNAFTICMYSHAGDCSYQISNISIEQFSQIILLVAQLYGLA